MAARPITSAHALVSFVSSNEPDAHPAALVDRLIFARSLVDANAALSPRLAPGATAAAHLIVLDDAADAALAHQRLIDHGFALDAVARPPAVAFAVRSAHHEEEIHALVLALTSVVRELYAIGPLHAGASIARCRTRVLGER